jgi:hypothetical protein
MRVAWTGHRPDVFRDPVTAEAIVERTARELLHGQAVGRFLVGGQRGVDTWAAESAHRLGVPFSVLLPLAVPAFTQDWQPHDRARLERTLGWAADVRVVGGDAADAFTERNRLLATSADLLVAVWTQRAGGGTAETVAFARAGGTPLREIVLEPSADAWSAGGRGI